jgi:hypothetical protein
MSDQINNHRSAWINALIASYQAQYPGPGSYTREEWNTLVEDKVSALDCHIDDLVLDMFEELEETIEEENGEMIEE